MKSTLEPQDTDRLNTQLNRVKFFMLSGEWKTLREIADHVQGSEAGVSARLRDLRNKYHYTVNRRRVNDQGLWEYSVSTGSVQPVEYKWEGNQGAFL